MMYAQRFADGPRFRPASLGAALAINGGVIAALLLAAPDVIKVFPTPPLVTFVPAPDPTPPPPDPQPRARSDRPAPRPTAAPDPGPTPDTPQWTDTELGTGPTMGGDAGTGGGTVVEPAKPALPPLVGASFDARYADDVEPPYPDTLRDAGIEGAVQLRIVIGTDGRVRQATVLAGDPRLTRIALRHVLSRWRFRPATRGGVPEESTQKMIVRFRLDS